MKKLVLSVLAVLAGIILLYSQPIHNTYKHDISYFIPENFPVCNGVDVKINSSFNPQISQPKEELGFEIGEQFVDWNDVLKYMYTLEKQSDRISVKPYGKSYQNRDFIQVIITSKENHAKIGQLKEEHHKLTDVSQHGGLNIVEMPVFVAMTCSVHGNEASGVNSSLVTAYFFAASLDKEVEKILDNTVIILVPGLNPDGMNRFASWVNGNKSYNNVSDLSAREFTEPWPSSRTNHYWIDCNRDWLMCQHPEGQNGVKMFLEWMPNVVVDLHEQGGDIKGFYFSPGHPLRTHPYTPQLNQDLTYELTKHVAKSLDAIGTLYYSKEGYDDFYLGKGAAYGDVQGSVGILYEQVASRGYARPIPSGILEFPYTVRNQSFASIATIYASYLNREKLNDYQKEFYKNQITQSAKDPVKGYVFNSQGRKAIEYHFLKSMEHHQIDVYHLKQSMKQDGKEFNTGDSYVIPLNQKFYTKIKGMWENITEYKDSVFYDISTWTFPHAFNLSYSRVSSVAGLLGEKVEKVEFPQGEVVGNRASVAYVFESKELYSHNVISDLLRNDIFVRVSKKPFSYTDKDGKKQEFGYGTVIVQLQNQQKSADEIYSIISSSAKRNGVDVYAFNTGLMDDFDFGTPGNKAIQLPRIAMITGRGMGIADCGEIWFMLDRRFGIPPTLIEFNTLHKADLNKYNVIILANGNPTDVVSKNAYSSLNEWVKRGGTLIVTGKAYSTANKAGITDFKLVSDSKKSDKVLYEPYYDPSRVSVDVEGVILQCNLDITSPLGYGYSNQEVAIIKRNATVFDVTGLNAGFPMHYVKEPYLSGCISEKHLNKIANTPAAIVSKSGKGSVVYFADDLNFRSYWFGTTKVFMNAIFFGCLY